MPSWPRRAKDAMLAEGHSRGAELAKARCRGDRAKLVDDTLMEETGHGTNVDEGANEG